MARGDAVVDIITVGDGETEDVTVASGEEWVIKSFGDGAQGSSSRIQLYDGTLVSQVTAGDKTTAMGGAMMMIVNNGHYFQLRNSAGSDYTLAYGGYKTKDE